MRLALLLAFGLFLIVGPARAEPENAALFLLSDIPVDVSAPSAAQARDAALAQAQQKAFGSLLQRLNVPSVTAPDAPTLARMMQAFEIQKETIVGGRYIGVFSIQFAPDTVRSFLSQKGSTYTETSIPPYLVLPVVQEEDRAILWEDRTSWRSAWDDRAKNKGFIRLIVPAGELSDISLISGAEAQKGQPERLAALAQQYGVQRILVANLAPAPTKDKNTQNQRQVTLRVFSANGTETGQTSFPLPADQRNETDALNQMIQKTLGWIEKNNTSFSEVKVESAGPAQTIAVNIPVPTLNDWTAIRNKLTQTPPVTRANIVSMTRGLVHIHLDYRGETEALRAALASQNLHLVQDPSGVWTLSTTATETP